MKMLVAAARLCDCGSLPSAFCVVMLCLVDEFKKKHKVRFQANSQLELVPGEEQLYA